MPNRVVGLTERGLDICLKITLQTIFLSLSDANSARCFCSGSCERPRVLDSPCSHHALDK